MTIESQYLWIVILRQRISQKTMIMKSLKNSYETMGLFDTKSIELRKSSTEKNNIGITIRNDQNKTNKNLEKTY